MAVSPLAELIMTKRITITLVAGALGLLAISATSFAQKSPPNSATVPAESSPAATAPKVAPAPSASGTEMAPDSAAACKGLEERPCRMNAVCTWIIPTEATKDGQIPPAYCRKLGPMKKKKAGAATPSTSGSPADATPKD